MRSVAVSQLTNRQHCSRCLAHFVNRLEQVVTEIKDLTQGGNNIVML